MMKNTSPARRIQTFYPGFSCAGGFIDASESWIGQIRPLAACTAEVLENLIDDLSVGAVVHVHKGRLLHDPTCRRNHRRPEFMNQILDVERAFTIRVVVWPPPIHPKAIGVYPEISSSVYRNHPHLFRSGQQAGTNMTGTMPDALCTYRPGDGEWSWESGDLVDFIDYAAIFLAKHAVWTQTGGDRGGIWIGPQASHDPGDLIEELSPAGECRCGSGRPYASCHRPLDLLRADRGSIANIVRATRTMR